MESGIGVAKKLGIFAIVASAAVYFGKKDIAAKREKKHREESDALVGSNQEEFEVKSHQPGLPESLKSNDYVRESKYVGSGLSYSSRKPGDRLSLWNYFTKD